MANQPSNVDLHELAQKLREADQLGPEAQRALADLLDELAQAIHPAGGGADETAHLADSATHLADALRQQPEGHSLPSALERFEASVARVEARAPLASRIVRQLIETLASWGI
jgi:hypothetical protein